MRIVEAEGYTGRRSVVTWWPMARLGLGGFIMATTKVGIYRSYYGPIPTDNAGQPLPESEWLKRA